MKKLKNSLTIRGDSLYCPLSFSLDTYGNCLEYCHHCYFRKLNHVWGDELKPVDVSLLEKKLSNGLKNKNPRSSLAWAIKQKKTLRVGNKADPYQTADIKHGATREALKILKDLDWEIVIQTRFTNNLKRDFDLLSGMRCVIMPVVSPGMDRDWEELERKRTTPPLERIKYISKIQKHVRVGVNGEPFIPGFHTVQEFETVMKILKQYKIRSYNTYNFHFNDWVAKNLHSIGIDIEKIWYMNQDEQWKKILPQLIDLAKKYGIVLGCPDFVNSGNHKEVSNTCCGITVDNPTTFNLINWKRGVQAGAKIGKVFKESWDNIGDYEHGKKLMEGKDSKMYSLKDINGFKNKKEGLFK